MAQINTTLPTAKQRQKHLKKRSLWADAWLRLRKNKSAVVGMIMLATILLVVYSSPLYLDYDNDVVKPNLTQTLKFPAEGKLLGADELGRDVLARILWGGRISITIGIMAMLLSSIIGCTLGALSGYYGGKTDGIIMRSLDVFMAIPSLLLMITLVSVMKPTLTNLIIALAVGSVPSVSRMVRAQVLYIKGQEFIEAIRAQGASDFRIIVMHILPNAISPLISQFVMEIAGLILAISGLSFIGLGVQPPDPEWGAMLSSGREHIRDVWHVTAFPGLALVLTVVSLTLVGDGLRDALDPRMKR
ncbi:ABC transporter permease [Brevibacillus nitrificans]|uniref:ABC transporter permease n=1 Tax=Brevibacillus nitrificans TaxID=651560 RepID=UPI00285E37BE|nr:ABC transporter permease [Brevibacillus nitrificans]MDR7316105.1 peptide/nickel transport system permease protein [Brevibacillus nitrificans]